MDQTKTNHIIFILFILVVFYLVLHFYVKNTNKENFINYTTNAFDYNNNINNNLYNKTQTIMGPSQDSGINQNSNKDVYDNRSFNWTVNSSNPQIDTFTKNINDVQLRNNFERTYMLDPTGSVAQFDLSYNKISPNCCPAQYAPPFNLDGKNCNFAQEYVANQYSGMNFNDGYGCVCVTPKQADFYGSRGGNTD